MTCPSQNDSPPCPVATMKDFWQTSAERQQAVLFQQIEVRTMTNRQLVSEVQAMCERAQRYDTDELARQCPNGVEIETNGPDTFRYCGSLAISLEQKMDTRIRQPE